MTPWLWLAINELLVATEILYLRLSPQNHHTDIREVLIGFSISVAMHASS